MLAFPFISVTRSHESSLTVFWKRCDSEDFAQWGAFLKVEENAYGP